MWAYNILIVWNVFFASLVIFCGNLVYSIISLIFVILGSCFILFTLKIEFICFIIILIYVGAIAILFLFIVLVLKVNNFGLIKKKLYLLVLENVLYWFIFLKFCIYFYWFNLILCLFINQCSHEYLKNYSMQNVDLYYYLSGDAIIFTNIFSQKYIFFFIVGFILLFSMFGSIALCVRRD